MNDWTLLLGVTITIHFVFFLGWIAACKLDNYSIVDALWAYGIVIAGFALIHSGEGDFHKRVLGFLITLIWGTRLGNHLLKRIRKHHPVEDVRYQKLREVWRGREASSFFWFFQAQALSVLVLALPFFFIGRDLSPWGIFETIGFAVAILGIFGESLADHQLAQFVSEAKDPKAVCQTGLWRYSRHPNYFFEMVIWIGIFLFACGSKYGWATIYAPAIITYLLLKVTGIPPAEASSIKRRGDAYRDYQRITSPFIPLPPRTPKKS